MAAVDEVGDVTPTDEVKNDVFLGEGVVDDLQVVAVDAVLDGAVAVDKGVDVVIAVDVVLRNDVVVDVVLDDEIVVDGVLDDEVVVEVDEMVTNGVAVVRFDVGFDVEFVVAVTPRKKKGVNRFDNNHFICCTNYSSVECPCPYQLKIL